MGHLAVGKNSDLKGGVANQFDGSDGASWILWRDVDDDNFSAGLLNLAENCVGRTHRKAGMTENGMAQARSFQTVLQRG